MTFLPKIKEKISKQDLYLCGVILDVICLILIFSTGIKPHTTFISPLSSFLARISPFAKGSQIVLPNGQLAVIPDFKNLFEKDLKYKNYSIEKARQFMALEPGSNERARKEVELLKFLKKNNASAADVLFAAQASATRPARAYAMEYLWNLRQSGKLAEFKIFPLDDRKVTWAQDHNIDPRMLAIATDLYGPTTQLMGAQPELFFEAAKETKAKDLDMTKYIPNPAVIARLQMSETGWSYNGLLEEMNEIGKSWDFPKSSTEDRAFVNIGGVSAWDALNLSPEWFPSGHDDLVWIAQNLEGATGLPYVKNVKQMPGSARGYGDGSGGAIGPQFMPLNARLFMSWYAKANERLGNQYPQMNPFNPWMGTMLSYLYLSSEFYHRQLNINNVTDVVRPGYTLLTDVNSQIAYRQSDPRIKALLKWNPLYWEAKTAVEAGDNYSDLWNQQDTLTYSGVK